MKKIIIVLLLLLISFTTGYYLSKIINQEVKTVYVDEAIELAGKSDVHHIHISRKGFDWYSITTDDYDKHFSSWEELVEFYNRYELCLKSK